jgi:hypothetical protein
MELYHALGFSFTPTKWRNTEPYFSPRLFFCDGAVEWIVVWNPRKKDSDIRQKDYSIHSISSPIKLASGRRMRALDTEKMANTVVVAARKWQIFR